MLQSVGLTWTITSSCSQPITGVRRVGCNGRGIFSEREINKGGGGGVCVDITLQMSLLLEKLVNYYWMCKMRQKWKPSMCHIMKQQTVNLNNFIDILSWFVHSRGKTTLLLWAKHNLCPCEFKYN